jgi:hypothetical protein
VTEQRVRKRRDRQHVSSWRTSEKFAGANSEHSLVDEAAKQNTDDVESGQSATRMNCLKKFWNCSESRSKSVQVLSQQARREQLHRKRQFRMMAKVNSQVDGDNADRDVGGDFKDKRSMREEGSAERFAPT